MTRNLKCILFWWYVVLLMASFVGCQPNRPEDFSNAPSASQQSESTTPSDAGSASSSDDRISLAAEELAQTFKEDEAAANERFMGKEVELTGVVQSVGAFSYPGGYIYLAGIKWETVDKRPWEKVLPGQRVTVVGKFEVGGVMMKITDVSGERLVVSAEEIAREFRSDPDATHAKYDKKWLEMQGTVVKIDKPEAESASVYLVDTDEVVVRCRLNYEQNEFAEQLSTGNMVRMAGAYHTPENDTEVLLWGCFGISNEQTLPR